MIYKPLLFLLLGTIVGLYTAQKAVNGQSGPFAHHQGSWSTWQAPVNTGDDPYTRAHTIGRGRLVPSFLEMTSYEATRDQDGNVLDPSCRYAVRGRLDTVRWWRLVTEPRDMRDDGGHDSVVAVDSLFTGAGDFVVNVSRAPMPGNWLRAPDTGSMSLILMLYGPHRTIRDDRVETTLPAIVQLGCS